MATADGSLTLLNTALNATYHSTYGAMQESRHIFIERGLRYATGVFGKRLNIVEIGFGTGLNAFLSLLESSRDDLALNYLALEKYPVPEQFFDAISAVHGSGAAAFKQLLTCDWGKAVQLSDAFSLTKLQADATTHRFEPGIHLVYYDAFAPSVAPDMWQTPVFERLYGAMLPGAALVTFCAQGAFKRMLRITGFTVEALPGPKGKREITRAVKPMAG